MPGAVRGRRGRRRAAWCPSRSSRICRRCGAACCAGWCRVTLVQIVVGFDDGLVALIRGELHRERGTVKREVRALQQPVVVVVVCVCVVCVCVVCARHRRARALVADVQLLVRPTGAPITFVGFATGSGEGHGPVRA
jgi:hypothetical protein